MKNTVQKVLQVGKIIVKVAGSVDRKLVIKHFNNNI